MTRDEILNEWLVESKHINDLVECFDESLSDIGSLNNLGENIKQEHINLMYKRKNDTLLPNDMLILLSCIKNNLFIGDLKTSLKETTNGRVLTIDDLGTEHTFPNEDNGGYDILEYIDCALIGDRLTNCYELDSDVFDQQLYKVFADAVNMSDHVKVNMWIALKTVKII